MKFTETHTQKYGGITAQDLKDFENRKILFHSTGASCLGAENAVLTLENEVEFYKAKNRFFDRLAAKKFKNYNEEQKQTFFHKWIHNFIAENHKTNKAIEYVYTKATLDELKEASIILFNQEKETINESK